TCIFGNAYDDHDLETLHTPYSDQNVGAEADSNNIGKKAIGTKWVYRNKKDERGIVVRNKSRLVAQGYKQEECIDYDEVFAPVARVEAIRLFLAFASFMNFPVYQMDIKSTFLYGTIEEEVQQFWKTSTARTSANKEVELTTTIDGQVKTITEAFLRRHLKLEDNGGVTTLPNSKIFEKLALMGYVTDYDKLSFQKGHFSP
ncbi:copia protein, partial [Tanacetum coccineum]